ncbi:MAG: MFS transporter [Alphaproteobacteria bacterium]|nr:MFS transporter [Alphaproteobacteria bacterium]MCY4318788.1 MFS transporter [Alphaproteobacteria bacterium]
MSARFLLWIMCGHLGLNLIGLHGLPALLPDFIARWSLAESEAGWLAGAPYISSIFAILVNIGSDRFDARRLIIAGSAANAAGFLGFAILADGFWSGLGFRLLQGIGFAWIYMPGVKVIADRTPPGSEARAGAFYISTFPIAASCSYVMIYWLDAVVGWRFAFAIPGFAAIVAGLLVWSLIAPKAMTGAGGASFDLRPVFANRNAMRVILANFCHSIELLALRSWMVAFFVFAATTSKGAPDWNWPLLAMVLTLLGAPMGMAGTWLGTRLGMARVSALSLLLSGTAASIVGFAADWPFWLLLLGPVVLHNLFVLMDSGTLAGSIIEASSPALRGRSLTLHAFANAAGGFVGPALFGTVLEVAGGAGSVNAWGYAFASAGVIAIMGAMSAAAVSRRK